MRPAASGKPETLAAWQRTAADIRIEHRRFHAEILAPLHVEEHRRKVRFERRMSFENDFTRRAGSEFHAHAIRARAEHQIFGREDGSSGATGLRADEAAVLALLGNA